METPLLFIVGCTGSGKGAIAREIACRIGGEVVSLDSMKVYRWMDIGTAKPPTEARRQVPHHLIDLIEPSEEFSVARYVSLADEAIMDIRRRGRPIVFVGGTPMYLKALTEGLFDGPGADPEVRRRLRSVADASGVAELHRRLQRVDPAAAARIHPNDLRRVVRALEVYELCGTTISALQQQWDRGRRRSEAALVGLRRDLVDQNHRMNQRVHRMIEAGLVDEVKALLSMDGPLGATARKAVGYAEIIKHLEGRIPLADAVEMIKINTRRFAKSQRTWFRRFRDIEWIDLSPDATVPRVADLLLERRGLQWSK